MQFSQYLKTCRERLGWTQEQLVHELYLYDSDLFDGLNNSTLSKWERDIVAPKLSRKLRILSFYQEKTGKALPCWDDLEVQEAEEKICRTGMGNLIGRNKHLVLNFPADQMLLDDLEISPLRDEGELRHLVSINMDIHQSINSPYTQVAEEQFLGWALHPGNLFYACRYKGGFLGLLFALKLNNHAFEEILAFQRRKNELELGDFVAADEPGSIMPLSFFAMNEKVATMLLVRFYAHLIANQRTIDEIGGVTGFKESQEFVKRMNLRFAGKYTSPEGSEIRAYRQSLKGVVASEYFIRMLFDKEKCAEEG